MRHQRDRLFEVYNLWVGYERSKSDHKYDHLYGINYTAIDNLILGTNYS